jgi:hypothetical protein
MFGYRVASAGRARRGWVSCCPSQDIAGCPAALHASRPLALGWCRYCTAHLATFLGLAHLSGCSRLPSACLPWLCFGSLARWWLPHLPAHAPASSPCHAAGPCPWAMRCCRYGDDEDFSDGEGFIKAFWSEDEGKCSAGAGSCPPGLFWLSSDELRGAFGCFGVLALGPLVRCSAVEEMRWKGAGQGD